MRKMMVAKALHDGRLRLLLAGLPPGPRLRRAGGEVRGEQALDRRRADLLADEIALADKERRGGEMLLRRDLGLVAEVLVQGSLFLDVEATNLKLRVFALDVLQIVLSAIALVAAGLVEVGGMDHRFGRRRLLADRRALSRGALGHRGPLAPLLAHIAPGTRACTGRGRGGQSEHLGRQRAIPALGQIVLNALLEPGRDLSRASQHVLADKDLGDAPDHHLVFLLQLDHQLKVGRVGDAALLDENARAIFGHQRLKHLAMGLLAYGALWIVEVDEINQSLIGAATYDEGG